MNRNSEIKSDFSFYLILGEYIELIHIWRGYATQHIS